MIITFTQDETAAIVEAHVRSQLGNAAMGRRIKIEFNGRHGYLSECTAEISEYGPGERPEVKVA